jgi:hypothetical protein
VGGNREEEERAEDLHQKSTNQRSNIKKSTCKLAHLPTLHGVVLENKSEKQKCVPTQL